MRRSDETILLNLFNKYKRDDCEVGHQALLGTLTEIIIFMAGIRPVSHPHNPLSAREMFCLILLAIGKTPDQCADMLQVTIADIFAYEKKMRKKLDAKNRTHAFYMALSRGYIALI